MYEFDVSEGGVSPQLLTAMRDSLIHRGPDAAGMWISDTRRIGLAHRRLAIVDLEHGDQPMFGRDGTCLVFNGEIYNYPQLRDRLEATGARFETNCDTEVILRLYERDGLGCVEHLNGMFAFALWDPACDRLMLARDRIGEKPLYWTQTQGRIIFGSEIKALLEHPLVTADVNREALVPYLANLTTPSPCTLFAGIFKLRAGTFATVEPRYGICMHSYWDLFPPRRFTELSDAAAIDKVRELLDKSVQARLMSDVPVGVLLSGGIDSTTLVALLREQATGFATFSVGFDDHSGIDERGEARRVANHFGTDHHEIVMSEADAIAFLPQLVHHQDEPLADPVCLPLHFVCALARAHGVKVVLAGEGADELFWGYPSYRRIMDQWSRIQRVLGAPKFVRRLLPQLVPPRLHPYGHELLQAIAAGRLLPAHLPIGLSRYHRRRFLGADGGLAPGWTPSTSTSGSTPLDTFVFDTQEYEFGVRLPELLLMRIDRFSMANSIEARVPFLDPRLVEFVYRLPVAQKLSAGVGKLLLRGAVADIVPDWVLSRRKQGFGAPIAEWLGTRLGDVFRRLLSEEAVGSYFDVLAVKAALRDGRSGVLFSLWPVMNFALWHIHWIERRDLTPILGEAAARSVVPV